jgi:hypothetical protein
MDLYPTLIELAGGRCADGQPVDGADLTPLLRGEDALGDRPLFWYDPVYRVLKEEISTPTAAVRLGEYKLMKSYHDGLSLYNLHEDMGETNNLAGAMPEKAAELERLVDAWMAETGVCPPYPNAAYDASARIPRQVEDFSPEGAELVRTWDFSERENFWRAARHCEVAAAGQAMRVKFTGFYPEVVTNIDARPGVYVAVLRYRYPANGRFRMHWAEKGPGRNGTVELYPEDDGEWHEVAALFEARKDVAELRIAAGVNRLRYGWHDPSRDREYAELRRIRLYRL